MCTLVQDLTGYKDNNVYDYGISEERNLSLGLALVAGLPVAGIINNFAWGQMTSTSRAFQKFNRRLVEDNSDVDVFLNPRYEIQQNVSWFSTKTKVKGSVMGARLITD